MKDKQKRLLLAIGVPVLVIILLIASAFILKVKNKESNKLTGLINSSNSGFDNLLNNSELTAILYKESGEVSVKQPDGAYVLMNLDEMPVISGTAVKTKIGLAHVILPDNSVMSISENTEVVVEFENKSTSITQIIGKTWHRVESVIFGNSYSVETPSTLATVRGTEFGVEVDAAQVSTVNVVDSVVEVSQIEKKAGKVIIKDKKNVSAGDQAYVPKYSTGKKMNLQKTPSKKKEDPWFKRNEHITKKIITSEDAPKKNQEQKKEIIKKMNQDPVLRIIDSEKVYFPSSGVVGGVTDTFEPQVYTETENYTTESYTKEVEDSNVITEELVIIEKSETIILEREPEYIKPSQSQEIEIDDSNSKVVDGDFSNTVQSLDTIPFDQKKTNGSDTIYD